MKHTGEAWGPPAFLGKARLFRAFVHSAFSLAR